MNFIEGNRGKKWNEVSIIFKEWIPKPNGGKTKETNFENAKLMISGSYLLVIIENENDDIEEYITIPFKLSNIQSYKVSHKKN